MDGKDMPGFDREKHAAYVALGYCPSVDSTKAYCCLKDGHGGTHFSLRLHQDKTFSVGRRWWF